MAVRRATIEDWQEDAQAAQVAAAAAAVAAKEAQPGFLAGEARVSGGDGVALSNSSIAPDGSSVSSSSSLGERLVWYGKVVLVTAVVGFKIAEWWTRVEAQVRGCC